MKKNLVIDKKKGLVIKPKYRLTMTSEHLGIVCRALDLYMRIHMGQLENISWLSREHGTMDAQRFLLDALKALMFPKLAHNASYGIGREELGDANDAADIEHVLRHARALAEPIDGYDKDRFEPMFYGRIQERPECEVVKKQKRPRRANAAYALLVHDENHQRQVREMLG